MALSVAPREAGSTPYDVATFGESGIDLVGRLAGRLVAGTKIDLEALEELVGGQAATAAVACARLGWRSRYLGVLGRDEAGETIARRLREEGVDVLAVWREGVASRTAVVLVNPDGDRTVLSRRPAALSLDADETPTSAATSGRVLIVDATDLPASIRMARAARAAAVPVIVDVDQIGRGVDDLLAESDILIVPAGFPEAFTGLGSTGAALAALATRFQPALAVVTLGAEGSLAVADGRELRTRPPDTLVRDTTGAGDAFRGGFAAAWLERGPAAEPDDLLRYANAVAALNCRALGALDGLPRRAELAPYL
jgi:sugar/nucleoside kinase (ribokinase family)